MGAEAMGSGLRPDERIIELMRWCGEAFRARV
jgi:hypothetical protein